MQTWRLREYPYVVSDFGMLISRVSSIRYNNQIEEDDVISFVVFFFHSERKYISSFY